VNRSIPPAAESRRLAWVNQLVPVAAAVIGFAATVALYLGLVHVVPLVDWGADEEALLRSEGALKVRSASVFAVLAGGLLLLRQSWRVGVTAVMSAGVLGVLADADRCPCGRRSAKAQDVSGSGGFSALCAVRGGTGSHRLRR
jgi:hypothetical protein